MILVFSFVCLKALILGFSLIECFNIKVYLHFLLDLSPFFLTFMHLLPSQDPSRLHYLDFLG